MQKIQQVEDVTFDDIANNQEGPSEQRTEAILETESNNEFTVKYVEKDPMTLGSLLTSNFVEGDCLRVDDLSPDVSEDSDDSQQVPYLSEEDSGDSFRVEEDTDDTHRVEECDVESESESDNVVVDQATGERILKLLVEPERGELNDDYKGIMRLVKAEKTPLKYMYKIIIDPLSGCNTSKELELIDRLCDVDIKVSSDVLSSPAILCGGGGLSADDETTSSNASEEKGSKKVAIAHSASAVASNEEHIIGDPVLQKCRVKTPCRTRPKRTEKCPKQWQDYLCCSDDKEGLPSYISVFPSYCGPPVQVSSGPSLAVIESFNECNPADGSKSSLMSGEMLLSSASEMKKVNSCNSCAGPNQCNGKHCQCFSKKKHCTPDCHCHLPTCQNPYNDLHRRHGTAAAAGPPATASEEN